MAHVRAPRLSAIFFTVFVLPALPAFSSPLSLPPPDLRIEAAGLLGLDDPFRGGRMSVGVGFGDAVLLPSLRLALAGDLGLAAWLVEPSIAIALGSGLSLFAGLVETLGPPELEIGATRRLKLKIASIPALFGVEARFGGTSLSPALKVETYTSIEWTAWSIAGLDSTEKMPGYASDDALRVFSAGFRAALSARLSLSPWSARLAPPAREAANSAFRP